ncbi:putative DNA modification/repair radical SAM protein [Geobacter sp. DSM 9736]|uniref:putative DNA modification/repair radical SAM protein n=1 Tax=Geobacter sp. DSM 9736 TaxID=1277350 RepID=UPI000B50A3C6|nr:putative DNA modification/repair radical SAM protein [Geobacter sp. DSM 9736]SNB47101.1 putative DNA modification/repair radical SAM protein [Geobacter sp. DSM 9736]
MITLPIEQRLEILADSAKFDVSCSSSGSNRAGKAGALGSTAASGICHTWTADGRCISLLKILLTNACIYDCAYCLNRRSNDIPRAAFTANEVVDLTMNFYRRNYIEGLFLSTGVIRSADYTMEQLIAVAQRLREVERFNGYIHLKLVPGADPLLIALAGRYADRVSINIELPTRRSLALLAPDKPRESVIDPMRQVSTLLVEAREARTQSRKSPRFAPAGQSTQLIVGATPESDREIITLTEGLYKKLELKRVYYSAYIPGSSDRRLPALPTPPLLREHRLYQADWLLRFYGFAAHELLDEARPNLDMRFDPKSDWALRHLELFPVEVNRVDYEVLLRVPGIGVRSAQRIVQARRGARLGEMELKKLGVVLKRAKYFLTADGRYLGGIRLDGPRLMELMLAPTRRPARLDQLELFDALPDASALTGEL